MGSFQPHNSLFNWNPPCNIKIKKTKEKHHHSHRAFKRKSSVSFLLKVKGLKPESDQLSAPSVLRAASSRGSGRGGRSCPSLPSQSSRRTNVTHSTPSGAPSVPSPPTPRSRSRSSRRQSRSPPGVASPSTHTSRRDTPRTARRNQLRCRNIGCPNSSVQFSSRRALQRHETMNCPTLTQV